MARQPSRDATYATTCARSIGFVFPGFTYLAFTVGRSIDPALLIPGLTAITAFFSAGSIGPAVLPLERKTKTLQRLMVAPISPFAIILGKTLTGATFGLVMSMVPLLIGIVFLGVRITDLLLFVPGILLSALMSSALGMVFAARAQEMPEAMMPMNLIRFPMLFLSGIFVPVEAMSGILRPIAYLVPLTYSASALRQTVLGPMNPLILLRDLGALTLFVALLLALATKALQRELQ